MIAVFSFSNPSFLCITSLPLSLQGPVKHMNSYLERVGVGACPEGRNPADHILRILEPDKVDESKKQREFIDRLPQIFMETPEYAEVQHTLDKGVRAPPRAAGDEEAAQSAASANKLAPSASQSDLKVTKLPPFGVQLKEHLKRSLRQGLREKNVLIPRMGSTTFMALFVSSLFSNQPHNQQVCV